MRRYSQGSVYNALEELSPMRVVDFVVWLQALFHSDVSKNVALNLESFYVYLQQLFSYSWNNQNTP